MSTCKPPPSLSAHSFTLHRVAFHGDYILSKSANENKIVLWAIQNFNSKLPPPPAEKVPTTHEYRAVRSAFGGTFERILQFKVDDALPFFMRPALFAQPGYHPILAMGNSSGKVFLWDLYMIEMYGRGAGLGGSEPESARDSSTPGVGTPASGGGGGGGGGKVNIKRDDISELFGVVRPHHTLDLKQAKSTIRHIAFSLDGKYMVVVGENSTITICKRW
jgi:polycomb protein EED